MVRPDSYLEMATTRYTEVIWELDLHRGSGGRTSARKAGSPLALRATVAACLRRLADIILTEPEIAGADILAAPPGAS